MYLPTPLHELDATQGRYFKRSLIGFNSVFLLLDWLKSTVYPTILSVAGWRVVGLIFFSNVLVLYQMQTTLSIYYDEIH